MRRKKTLLALCLGLFAAPAYAQTTGQALDVNLNSDAVRLSFAWQLGDPRYLAELGWPYHQDKGD